MFREFKSVFLCVRRGGSIWKRFGRIFGIGRGGVRCVCGSVWLVRRSGRIFIRSRFSYSGKVFYLEKGREVGEGLVK